MTAYLSLTIRMSALERLFHALLFEIGALLSTVLLMDFLTNHSTSLLATTIILISIIAMVWNVVFNLLFDRWFPGERLARGLAIRLLHTTAFELGLLLFTVPLVALMLNIGWWEAFVMDIGMTLFVMSYSLIFNWLYDYLRAWLQWR